MNKHLRSAGGRAPAQNPHTRFRPRFPLARLAAPAAMLGLCAVYYWPVLSLQGVIWNDFIEQYFPYRVFAATSLRSGEFPFWNPYVFSGMPFFADIQSAVLYPLNFVLTLFSSRETLSPVLFEYQIVAHIFLAGLFMYMLVRDLGMGPYAALLSAMAYMFSGFATTHIFHATMIHALPWFPLTILFVQRMLARESAAYAGATALALFVIATAGHPQLLLYFYYWLAAYFAFNLFAEFRARAAKRRLLRISWLFALALALGIALSAVQLLPTKALGEQSARPEMEFAKSCEGSFRPYRWVTLIAPNFFGTPNNISTAAPAYWGFGGNDVDPGAHYYWETAMYPGVVMLLLALCAIAAACSPLAVFLGIAALLSLLLAMGDSFFLYRIAHEWLPGIGRFRIPGRFSSLFALSISMLAGIGAQWLLSKDCAARARKSARWLPYALSGLAAAAVLWAILFSAGSGHSGIVNFLLASGRFGADSREIAEIAQRHILPHALGSVWTCALLVCASAAAVALRLRETLAPRITAFALLGVAAADFLLFGYGYAAMRGDPRSIYAAGPLIRQIRAQLASGELYRINSRDSNPGTSDLGGRNMIFHKNQGSVHRIFLIEGYNPLRLKRQLADRKERTLDILNVKYRIDTGPSSATMRLAAHPTQLPRAWMVFSWDIATDEAAIIDRMYDPAFDHRRQAVLEEQPGIVPATDTAFTPCSARIVRYGANRIELDCSAERDGLLMLSEIHYPAWKATVDGKAAPLLRADYALRAIPVGRGAHRVVCYYRDDAFRRGLLLSLAAAGAVCGLFFFGRKRRPAAPGQSPAPPANR